jgi:hypothetical protein
MAETRSAEATFIDHYYTLGIAIDAHGDLIEDVYWGMIRDSRKGVSEPLTPSEMDQLNEAYRVLTTPSLRRAYDEERAEVLGPNAAPQAPVAEEAAGPPLPFLERHVAAIQPKPRPANPIVAAVESPRWVPLVASIGGIGTMISLAIVRLFI